MYYYNPIAFGKLLFKTTPKIRHEYQIFYWNRSGICKFDRSGAFNKFKISDPRFDLKSKFNLPVYDFSFNKTFEEICLQRAKNIIDDNDKINLFWSGGLDSTTILLSFHQYFSEIKDKLKVVMTKNSVRDNPTAFEEIIKPNYEYVILEKYSDRKPHYSLEHVNVTGDNNECIFGWSGLLQLFAQKLGIDVIHTKLDDIHKLKNKMSTEVYKHFGYFFELREIVQETFDSSPVPIDTIMDLNWWFVYNFCWQYDYYRFMVPEYKNYKQVFETMCPFFADEMFENWIVNNYDEKLRTLDNLNYHKKDEIEFISKYLPNADMTPLMPRKTNVDLSDLVAKDFLLINDNYDLVPCPSFLNTTLEDVKHNFVNVASVDEMRLLFD